MAVVSPYEIEQATILYTNTLRLMLQQMDSRLQGTVDTNTTPYRGKQVAPVSYISPFYFKQAAPRGSPLTGQFSQYQRRWVAPQNKDVDPILVDTFDQLLGVTDPKSSIVQAISAAANRIKDDVIMRAFFGTAVISGNDSSNQTNETFDSGANFPISVSIADTFGVGSEVGMTVEKMNEAHRILAKYEVPEDMTIHMGMTSQALKDLKGQVEFISTDFRANAMLDQMGRPKAFNNTVFHYSERWPYNPSDSDERWLPMWVEGGMHLGIWEDIDVTISQRNDLVSHPWQVYPKLTIGATRLQAGMVVRIAVKDTTGGSVTV